DVAVRRRRDLHLGRAPRKRRPRAAAPPRQGADGPLAYLPPLPHPGRRLDLHCGRDRRPVRGVVHRARRARDRERRSLRDFRRALGVPESASDVRLATSAARNDHRRQLETILEPRFRTKTSMFWTRTFDDAGVPNEVPLDTHGGELPLFDADNVELGLVAHYE